MTYSSEENMETVQFEFLSRRKWHLTAFFFSGLFVELTSE
jgi:hypothetical protein